MLSLWVSKVAVFLQLLPKRFSYFILSDFSKGLDLQDQKRVRGWGEDREKAQKRRTRKQYWQAKKKVLLLPTPIRTQEWGRPASLTSPIHAAGTGNLGQNDT